MSLPENMIPRQGHKKSRNGCTRCKQRRVKCDEKKPCSNCRRRNEDCDLTFPRVSNRCPNCAAKDIQAANLLLSPTAKSEAESTDSSRDAFTVSTADWNRDMYLMHHWSLYTAKSITVRSRQQRMWSEVAPELAVHYPMLTSGLLTITALHLAHLRPNESSTWLPLSFKHQMAAIAAFRETIAIINEDNCHALFAVASTISIASMAWSSRPDLLGQELTFQDVVEPFFLTRGIGEVVAVASEWLRTGPMQILLSGYSVDFEPYGLPEDTQSQFEHLADLVSATFSEDQHLRDVILKNVESLRHIFLEVRFRKDAKEEFGMLWKFCVRSTSEFVALLREMHPCALVIFAHFAILSKCLADRWCLIGWPERVLAVITDRLDVGWREWLKWPAQQLRDGLTVLRHEVEAEAAAVAAAAAAAEEAKASS